MITREYVVALINGDYAILEDENKEQISIADRKSTRLNSSH